MAQLKVVDSCSRKERNGELVKLTIEITLRFFFELLNEVLVELEKSFFLFEHVMKSNSR